MAGDTFNLDLSFRSEGLSLGGKRVDVRVFVTIKKGH